ncbi:unnamed protein product [Adineta ricciae]|nr:unnamed protein product [Adineta ricciae]
MNGTNPFDLPASSATTTTIDPFGISYTMKLSESSEKFDDNPFTVKPSGNKAIRPRSGKEALSSSNWLAYQHSMDEANLDGPDDLSEKSLATDSYQANRFNPFDSPTIPETTPLAATSFQAFPADFLFDTNTDSNQVSTADSNQSSYAFLDFNQTNASSPFQVVKDDTLTDITLLDSTKTSQPSLSTTESNPLVTSSSNITHTQTPLSTTISTNVTFNTGFNDQFLDWLTPSSGATASINSITNQSSPLNEFNTISKSEDPFGLTIQQSQSSSAIQGFDDGHSSPSSITLLKQTVRRPSNEVVPSIHIQELTVGHNNTNVVSKGYYGNEKKNQSDDDSEDDKKMVFHIGERKGNMSTHDSNIPLPLLPPPPSPSSSKKYKEVSDDASSSSSESDEDDPLAIFRSKPTTQSINQQPGRSLFTDWDDETTTATNEQAQQSEKIQSIPPPPLDYYLHEPDYDDSAPLEPYHNDINELQLQQLNGWLLQIRVPLRQKDLYKSTFQRFSETRTWQECYVRIFFDEKKLRFYLPQTIEQSFAEIELQTWYQCTKFNLQQLDQYSKIHTFKIYEANYREIPQVRIDRLVTLPEKLFRRFTRPNKAQQVLLDHANCVQQEIVKFGQLNYTYLKQFFIILDDLFWSMPVTRSRLEKHLKEEITVKIVDEYYAHIDKYHHICKHKSRTRLFLLAFLNGTEPVVEIGMNDWFRHGKEVNKRNEIIINKTLQEYWIKPEQVELASVIDANEYENTHLLKLIPPDSQKVEIMRFRTRPKQNIELPLQVYCFMSVIKRQVNIRIEATVSNAFNISILSKASSVATNDKTANVRDDNSDEQCPCEDIQIRFPIPDPWVYMFRVEKRFRYGAIHSVRRKAGKIKGLDRLMVHRNDALTPFMAASAGVAKYEQAFRSIVWRIDQLPKRDQGAYKTHVFECSFSVAPHDPVPEKYEPIADVEYCMSQAFVSHCQIRSVAVPSAEETPEKWIRPKSLFTYTIDIEYAFKEEEKKEFAPIEIDMKEQTMSQSEAENNSQSDDSD